jgi:AraC family transcriptional regulator
MKSILGITFLAVLALIAVLLIRLGAFKDVLVTRGEAGPFLVVSKHHNGAYHKIVSVIEEVEAWAKKNGEPCRLSFGEYLDNVDLVEEDRLQSNAGCVVKKTWKNGLPEGFIFREWPKRQYVLAEFSGAPSIGPQKVYPKAKEFMVLNHLSADGPVVEMYEILPEQKILTKYYFPVKASE